MNKKKKWQLFIILTVLSLTIYNILPTIFYYSKPLKSPIENTQAEKIAKSIFKRVNSLEEESINWINSFCSHINVKPKKVYFDIKEPQQISVSFSSVEDAKKFKTFLPKAGSLKPFAPSRLTLLNNEKDPKVVSVQRLIPIHFDLNHLDKYYTYGKKFDDNGNITTFYKDLIFERASQLAFAIAGQSERTTLLNQILNNSQGSITDQIFALADYIVRFDNTFESNSSASKRFYSNFWKQLDIDPKGAFNSLISHIEHEKDNVTLGKIALKKKEKELSKDNSYLNDTDYQNLLILTKKEETLATARAILKKNESILTKKPILFTLESANELLEKNYSKESSSQIVSLSGLNPFIENLQIDWKSNKISIHLHNDILEHKKLTQEASSKYENDQLEQLIINEIAFITRKTDEKLGSLNDGYVIELDSSPKTQSFLCLDLKQVAASLNSQLVKSLNKLWKPKHPELQKNNFPIVDLNTYSNLPPEQKSLCLTVISPVYQSKEAADGMKEGSIYVVAKGFDKILNKYRLYSESEDAQMFIQDFQSLREILYQLGFVGYPASQHISDSKFINDFIFENDRYYQNLLNSTRENFKISGSKKFALLELSDVEQRILTQNKIETKIHEDLLKWKDDFNSSQVSVDSNARLSVPKPTKSIFWNNMRLSLAKYFRGDERKILHWGLDLSGGKTVSIELKDQNNKTVKNEDDLKQGMSELYTRVNKMGVSEVNLRLEGNRILLDFPGSQNLSASDLVKASSMYFHIVNEKFSDSNQSLRNAVNQFLQEVWNEAVVFNKKDAEMINEIAYKHLYGDSTEESVVQPRTPAAKILYDNGLRLASANSSETNSNYNDTYSKIAIYREADFTKWSGQTHPLLIVFKNYALEGSSLSNIRSSYDPAKGNFLSFEVKSSVSRPDGTKFNPRTDFHAWTSQFSKDSIQGTSNENLSQGRGWRMAVILNETIISSPTLDSALKDSAMISGSFSQREANQLAADLKAGSLTFTPKILSEKNVSPELGKQDRQQGIIAMVIALAFVIIAMISYYRFAGLVASVAVLFNLIIMWAVLQNIQAVLTLSGIAGIILTVGMAVDANVLVFERIKEELSLTKKLSAAVTAGYKKAFTAILDSNVTTIIAALILLNFDSGPIKGFALTLIIGIASSMFTALFMTRFFFMKWAEDPQHQSLKMMNLIKPSKFNFLGKSKIVIAVSSLTILIGSISILQNKDSLIGMDFTGGHSVSVELAFKGSVDYRKQVEDALQRKGASTHDFSVRELSPSNNIRIMISDSLITKSGKLYPKSSNPPVQWIVDGLKEANVEIESTSLKNIESSWTSISGQVSSAMKKNATLGLLLALIAILGYIAIRFEWKYSLSAILCLMHDVIISISAVAIFRLFGVPVQIDMNTIAALMTIIGYSLNDTIIIFDRIREDLSLLRKESLSSIVNHALNVTLSRTLMTSITTMLVLLALVGFGGKSIFSFALVMCVGVIFGTLSSLFIASPLMLAFHKMENRKEQKSLTSRKA